MIKEPTNDKTWEDELLKILKQDPYNRNVIFGNIEELKAFISKQIQLARAEEREKVTKRLTLTTITYKRDATDWNDYDDGFEKGFNTAGQALETLKSELEKEDK